MNKALLIGALLLATAAHADQRFLRRDDAPRANKPDVTYVGGGRYSCRGSAASCYDVEQSNRRQEEHASARYEQQRREQQRDANERQWRRDVNDRLDDIEAGAYYNR